MHKLTREQIIAVVALGAFIVTCVGLVAWSLDDRIAAAQDLADRHDVMERLETAARAKANGHGFVKRTKAPASAFIDAPTLGLASAVLEAHVTQLAGHHATLVSFAVQSASGGERADSVRIEASLDLSQRALQSLLYELESGQPYVFIDSMTLRPAAGSAQSSAADPLLRATLGLRALLRRNPA